MAFQVEDQLEEAEADLVAVEEEDHLRQDVWIR
jgi:hypothetical protein